MYRTANLLMILVLLLSLNLAASAYSEKNDLSVYIDPAFGGKDLGPLFRKKDYAKDLVLDLGKQLKVSMEEKGFSTHLSIESDQFMSVDERLRLSKSLNVSAYISLTMTKSKENCITVYVPKGELRRGSELKGNLKDADTEKLERDLQANNKIIESYALGNFIAKRLSEKFPKSCVAAKPKKSSLFEKAQCPIINIDFGVSDTQQKSTYILNPAFQNEIIATIASAFDQYFREAVGRRVP